VKESKSLFVISRLKDINGDRELLSGIRKIGVKERKKFVHEDFKLKKNAPIYHQLNRRNH